MPWQTPGCSQGCSGTRKASAWRWCAPQGSFGPGVLAPRRVLTAGCPPGCGCGNGLPAQQEAASYGALTLPSGAPQPCLGPQLTKAGLQDIKSGLAARVLPSWCGCQLRALTLCLNGRQCAAEQGWHSQAGGCRPGEPRDGRPSESSQLAAQARAPGAPRPCRVQAAVLRGGSEASLSLRGTLAWCARPTQAAAAAAAVYDLHTAESRHVLTHSHWSLCQWCAQDGPRAPPGRPGVVQGGRLLLWGALVWSHSCSSTNVHHACAHEPPLAASPAHSPPLRLQAACPHQQPATQVLLWELITQARPRPPLLAP